MSAHLPANAHIHQQLIGLVLSYLTGNPPTTAPAAPQPASPAGQTQLTLLEALALLPSSHPR